MKRFHLFRINLVFMIAGVLAVVALINVSVMRSRRSMVQVELETVANYQISSKMKSAAFPAGDRTHPPDKSAYGTYRSPSCRR